MTFEQSLQQRIKKLEKKGVTFSQTELEEIKNKLLAGICPICSKKKTTSKLCIDHDHKTKKYRGVICIGCNYYLGVLHDNAELLANLSLYLTKSDKN